VYIYIYIIYTYMYILYMYIYTYIIYIYIHTLMYIYTALLDSLKTSRCAVTEMLRCWMEQVYSPESSWPAPVSVTEPLVSSATRGSDSRGGRASPSLQSTQHQLNHSSTGARRESVPTPSHQRALLSYDPSERIHVVVSFHLFMDQSYSVCLMVFIDVTISAVSSLR